MRSYGSKLGHVVSKELKNGMHESLDGAVFTKKFSEKNGLKPDLYIQTVIHMKGK